MNVKLPALMLCLAFGTLGAAIAPGQAQEVSLNPVSPAAELPAYMKGVNLSGAEYGPGPKGVYGTQYIYPSTQEFDYYKGKGFSIIRLPFDIARVQPASLQPLNQSELAHITATIEYARKKGMYIILDPHSYGKMWSQTANNYEPIGSAYISNGYFADFWLRLATVYKNYPNVLYGLSNEPNIQNPTQWKAASVAAINAIRSVSPSQTILIPGTYFTTAATWTKNGNSAAWTGYKDPVGGPFMFEMHQYLDENYSGRSATCVKNSGSTVLTDATAWLAANGFQGFLAEFDWYTDFNHGVTPACQAEGTALLNAMQTHPEQWGGWTWFGSGRWAWNNGVNLNPGADGTPGDQPQTATLVGFLASATQTGVANSSFESPATGSYLYNPAGGNWTFTGASGVQRNGSAWGAPSAPSGVQTAFLQHGTSNGNGTISQSISFPSTGTYSVTFRAALRSWTTTSTKMSFKVMIDNTVVGNFTPTSTQFSVFNTAPTRVNAGNHVLSFVGTSPTPDTSDFIDSVAVNWVSG
jgi:endoglucanase